MLGLIRLDQAAHADVYVYAHLLREHFRMHRGKVGPAWFANRDKADAPRSLDVFLGASRDLIARRRRIRSASQPASTPPAGASFAPHRARTGRRRAGWSPTSPTRSSLGTSCATTDSIRSVRRQAAGGESGGNARSMSRTLGGADHNRARHRTDCPYCVNRRVCRTNSLRATFPDIAAS